MCGILVCTDGLISLEEFKTGFEDLRKRGPDDARIIKVDNGIIGFRRLAIMGCDSKGMQPFNYGRNIVVCNGEIYGFRELKEQLKKDGYTFISDSDCELLLPLYEKYGVEMFGKLDSEFACVIYDGENDSWIAGRDPIGIRPLFYGYSANNKICFGSSVASLMPFAHDINPFPPGHFYKDGKFVSYSHIYSPDKMCYDNMDKISRNIHDKLIKAVEKRIDSDSPIGYLLSGGLDSSLICAIAQKLSDKPIRTFAIGMDIDAIDLKYAKMVADYIGSEHTEIIITKEDVINALNEVIKELASWDITTIRASIGMYLLCQKIHELTDIKVLLTGEISDELFGYKYTDYAPDSMSFQKEAEKRIKEIYMYDVLRADRCISANSLESRVPFGDLDFCQYVMSIDPEKKMNHYHMGKYLLRHAFEEDKLLPEEILFRDKAAFSDAVGHSLVDDLKEYAETKYTNQQYEALIKKYHDNVPFTKESLLYREIFENYYPSLDHLIIAYWMPNKSWQGCDVDDPSARYLANYGASAY